ncbi:MAG: formate dehydrogenase accessory protein FdhE [bacterium]|nr:formate dehydrogenase accessory protein FdhE [bacterium]
MGLTPIDIKKAVEALRRARPAYSDILAFYGEIFVLQEKSAESLSLSAGRKQLKPRNKTEGDFPLTSPSEIEVDTKAADTLLREICQITIRLGQGNAPASAQSLLDAVSRGNIATQSLYRSFLNADFKNGEKQAAAIGIDEPFLSFVTYHSLRPSLCAFARQAGTFLAESHRWEKAACPVCGSRPALAILEKDGKRSLFCSFCWHDWTTQRVYCPFCGSTDSEKLKYYEIISENEYRIDTCENCRNYLKTVDRRKTDRDIYPALENLATLHLDIKAQELGFENEDMPLLENPDLRR